MLINLTAKILRISVLKRHSNGSEILREKYYEG